MIDALFGSKTRVKLLALFMNNPSRSFYVREITRNIGEQLNSVRRELANLNKIGIISDQSVDNRLYYQVNTEFKYFHALRELFASNNEVVKGSTVSCDDWRQKFASLRGVSSVLFAGALIYGSSSPIDLVVAGEKIKSPKLKTLIKQLERDAGGSLNYTIMTQSDLYYRITIHDRFILNVLEAKHAVILDEAGLFKPYNETEVDNQLEEGEK